MQYHQESHNRRCFRLQDKVARLYTKSLEEREAEIAADRARIEAVKASEEVETTRAVANAERSRTLALVSAEADATASAKRAEIEAESQRTTAAVIGDANVITAEAAKAVKLAEAESHRAYIEASNTRSESLIAMELEKLRLSSLPNIVREMVKPAEKIQSININHLTGTGTSGSGGSDKSAVNQAVDSIMDMAVQLPVLKKIGESVGVNFDDGVSGIVDSDKRQKKDQD